MTMSDGRWGNRNAEINGETAKKGAERNVWTLERMFYRRFQSRVIHQRFLTYHDKSSIL